MNRKSFLRGLLIAAVAPGVIAKAATGAPRRFIDVEPLRNTEGGRGLLWQIQNGGTLGQYRHGDFKMADLDKLVQLYQRHPPQHRRLIY